MDLLIVGTLMLVVITLANILDLRNRRIEKLVFDAFLFLISTGVLFLGTMLVLIPPDFYQQAADITLNLLDSRSFGLVLIISGGWAMLLAVRKVRQILAKIMPLNPESPVHSLALVLSVYLLGYTALLLSQGGLSGLADSVEPAPLYFLILSELLFAIVALFGIGFLVRRRGRELASRLGLERPKPMQILVAVGVIALLVMLQACAGLIWQYLNPEQSEILEDVSATLLTEIDTVWEWLLIALATGIGEEILFRGALQPVFGLGVTSILFALVHIQYGYTPVTLLVVLIAIVLGVLRRYYSTTITIFVHVGYNFSLGLLALLAAYLQDIVA